MSSLFLRATGCLATFSASFSSSPSIRQMRYGIGWLSVAHLYVSDIGDAQSGSMQLNVEKQSGATAPRDGHASATLSFRGIQTSLHYRPHFQLSSLLKCQFSQCLACFEVSGKWPSCQHLVLEGKNGLVEMANGHAKAGESLLDITQKARHGAWH
ncbi:hypothetical protein N7450_007283 [Penicillium hetheringtonii]|uniref:Uncharacterized protein n=1 Tax=Penicillium hetheringtonii TaxID=911720 RepID=A0AAD6DH98_9EURO|nr:hypothetical protein N7450_007283 [Penicillium hetheringtonii]